MANGGFRRALKIESGVVVDQRPPGHPDATGPKWKETDIPANLSANLNRLMRAGALTMPADTLTVAANWQDLVNDKEKWTPGEEAILIRATKNRLAFTQAELDQAKQELENEH